MHWQIQHKTSPSILNLHILHFSTGQLSEAQEKAKIKTSHHFPIQPLEATLPKQKLEIFRSVKSTALKFWFRTIWFRKGHENDSMQKINFSGPNFLWKFLGVSGIYKLITIIILFTNFTKPYSSEPKLRRLRFGTFWRFLTFVLAKLPLKAELENGVTFLFLLTLELQKVGLCWSAMYAGMVYYVLCMYVCMYVCWYSILWYSMLVW